MFVLLPKLYRFLVRRFLSLGFLLYLIISPQQASTVPTNPSSSSPANGSTHVARESDLVLNFPITACVFPMGQLWLKKVLDPGYSDILMIDNDNSSTINVSLTNPLAADTQYYIEVDAGKFSTCDYNMANASDAFTIYFTTGNCMGSGTCSLICIGPVHREILHKSPPDGAHFMQSYEGLGLVFNGTVSVGSGNFYIKKYSDDSTVETIDVTSNRITGWSTNSLTIDPTINLDHNTHYYMNFDFDGYRTAGDKDAWDFWTKSTPNTFSGTGL